MTASRRETRRIRIDLAYDGTAFHGFQLQRRGRTVQGTLEAALARVAGDRPVRVRAASRTDAGVHARAQVVDCRLATRLDDAGIELALDRLLPADLRPVAVRSMPDSFHARHDAIAKTYRYQIDRSPHGDPLRARYAYHVPRELVPDRIAAALPLLVGRHDWSGFTDSRCRVKDRVRDLQEARYDETADVGWFTFRADGFLTYMVRNLVGTLLEIGAGRRPADDVRAILAGRDRTRAAAAAPPCGLTLWHVRYRGAPGQDETDAG